MSKALLFLSVLGLAGQMMAQSAGGGVSGAGGGAAGGATGGAGGGAAGGTTGGATGGTVVPGGNNSRRGIPDNPVSNPAANENNLPRPIFLSGKVMMDDGSPIPANVTIQRVCGGNANAVAYTDSKGRFSFQWGQNSGVFMDASESSFGMRSNSSGPFGSSMSGNGPDSFGNQMRNCDLQANLAGFRSDVVSLANRTSFDNPDVGTIVLHRLGNVEGLAISATSLMAPKDAKKSYERGLQMMLKNKTEDASKDFEKAVNAYPKYADAWLNLGKTLVAKKSNDAARDAFLKAIDADPKLVGPYLELGLMSAKESKWDESSKYLDRATKLDPVDYPQAWYVSAVAHYNLKNFDASEKSAREALKLDPKHRNVRAEYLLGLVLLEKRDYRGAEAQLKNYLKIAPDANDAPTVKEQLSRLQQYMKENEVAEAATDAPKEVSK